MFGDEQTPGEKIDRIIDELGDHALTKSHARHLSLARCRAIGLKITDLEQNQALQDAVLSVHHACMVTFSATPAHKIIENHEGVAFIKSAQQVVMPVASPANQEPRQPVPE